VADTGEEGKQSRPFYESAICKQDAVSFQKQLMVEHHVLFRSTCCWSWQVSLGDVLIMLLFFLTLELRLN